MLFLLWKMQSKVSSAYSIVGINALMRKNCRWWSLLRVSCRCKNPAEKPIYTHGTVHPPFLLCRGVLMFSFPPNLYLFMGMWAGLACEYTPCTAEGELKLPCSPHTQMVHTGSQDTGSSNLRVPSGQPCQSCAPLLQCCCASLILAAADFFRCV